VSSEHEWPSLPVTIHGVTPQGLQEFLDARRDECDRLFQSLRDGSSLLGLQGIEEDDDMPKETTKPNEFPTKTPADAVGVPLEQQFPILRYFDEQMEPLGQTQGIRDRAKPFAMLARDFAARGAKNPAELAAGLRKLLEARDCLIRAAL